MSRVRWVSMTLGLGLMLSAPEARAFCRKTTCPSCPVNPVTGCIEEGEPLAWPSVCVSYALTRAASRVVSLTQAKIVVAQAFQTWQAVTCPGTGAPPSILATDAFGLVDCALHEYNRGAGNANIVVFRDDSWVHQDAQDAVALTSMSFNERTGAILDADVEINATVNITTASSVPIDGYDLSSILTHEAGHFLGLAHSTLPDATMYPIYRQGTDDFRTLSDDDIAGICAIYPPDRDAMPCDFTPPGGFARQCALGITKGGCAVGGSPANIGVWYALVAVCFRLLTRRRRV
jgi:hypothetical protein